MSWAPPPCASHMYSRRVANEIVGCAQLACQELNPSARRLTAEVWWGGHWRSSIQIQLDGQHRPVAYQHSIVREDVERSLQGQVAGDRLTIIDEGSVMSVKNRHTAWGPSSQLDPGHPLLWGPILHPKRDHSVRVVRIQPLQTRGWMVDRFTVTTAGEDGQGHRLRVDSALGPVAMWLDDNGEIVRIRRRVRGPGSPVEDWLRVEDCLLADRYVPGVASHEPGTEVL